MEAAALQEQLQTTVASAGESLRSKVWYWVRKGSATICDQGLISGSNFVLTLTLAKWMGPSQYGAYAIMFSIFLLLGNVHQAVLLEPMSVFQPSLYGDRRREYIGSVVRLHAIASALFMIPVAVAAVVLTVMQKPVLANASAGLLLGIPCILLLWTARVASYLDCRPARAVTASVLYCAVLSSGLLVVYRAHVLNPLITFALMSFGALCAATVLLAQLKPRFFSNEGPSPREIWKKHWDYGRWSLASVGVGWLEINSFYLLTGTLLGIRDTGALAALVSFLLPINHLIAGSSRLLLPQWARISSTDGPRAVARMATRLSFAYFSVTAVYWALISTFRHPLMSLLYGRSFVEFAGYLPAATFCIMFAAATFPNELALRALKAPRVMLKASCISAFCSVALCATAVHRYGLIGAFIASGSVSMLHLTVITTFRRRETKRASREPNDPEASYEPGKTTAILRSPHSAMGLPVLVYHHVGPPRSGIYRTLTMSPKRFERQMAWLSRLGYSTPTEAEVLAWLRGEYELSPKSVMITFDDAYADLTEHALPTMMKFGFRGLIFVVTGHIGGTNVFDQRDGCGQLRLMSAEEIRQWAEWGFQFGSHTRGHRNLTSVPPEELADEIEGSGRDLTLILGRPAISFAYPYGAFNDYIESCAKENFPLVFTTRQGLNREGTPTSRVFRTVTDHHDSVVDILCRARWGRSPIESLRKTLLAPFRPFLAPFRSRFLPKLSSDV